MPVGKVSTNETFVGNQVVARETDWPVCGPVGCTMPMYSDALRGDVAAMHVATHVSKRFGP